jgi:excinuclease ABC subunit C
MEKPSEELRFNINTLPGLPGVYQFFDQYKEVIYVGKAKNLKKRVSSYFSKQQTTGKTILLVRKIVDLEYIVVQSEADALLLENTLIKKYKPRYNIQLKDDKTYPWICIKKEPFPRVFQTRRLIRDGSSYFGPYPNVKVMQALLQLIRELYPLRTCTYDLSPGKIARGSYKVCLEYHLGNCLGPCAGEQTESDYQQLISQIEKILRGDLVELLSGLKKQMKHHADKLQFEAAQGIKQQLTLLEKYQSRSTVVSPSIKQLDVCTVLEEEQGFYLNYTVVKNGAIVQSYNTFIQKKLEETTDDMLGYVLPELKERFHSTSKEVALNVASSLEFTDLKLLVPQRGEKKKLLEMSLRNVSHYKWVSSKREHEGKTEEKTDKGLEELQRILGLNAPPIHMECFDNSNIQGEHAVSACVVFKDGKPSKKDYRHFNVRTVTGPDDFATMHEVVTRRYKRLLEEGKSLPNLVVIDGGKGQLGAAYEAIDALGLAGKLTLVGIAKRLEELYRVGFSAPLVLDHRSEALKLIQHMRNEAHRFGITHHRNKRSKAAIFSALSAIPGVGQKTEEQLLHAFKSLKAIEQLSVEQLAEHIGIKRAQLVYGHFRREHGDDFELVR